MRSSYLLAILLVCSLTVLALAAVAQPAIAQSMGQVSPSAAKYQSQSQTKSTTGWSSLPPNARGHILAALAKDGVLDPRVADSWIQQAELTASDGAASNWFNLSVAVSGSTVVVGAPEHAVGSNKYQGAAYVFVQAGTTWSQQAELTASDGGADNYFGFSVAMSGSTVVVGAEGHKVGSNTNQGAAYVFVQDGATWSQQAELTASDGAAEDVFGSSVAVNGSTAVVGASFKTISSKTFQGAAYVFVQSGTTWSQQAELTASDGAADDYFGGSVALSGGTAVVGAFDHKVGSNTDQGAAYVFVQDGTMWAQQSELIAPDGAAYDGFGTSVAVSGSTVVVGAFDHNSGQGAAYVFVQSGATWSQQAELTASDGHTGDGFGVSVALSGSTVVVGASYKSIGLNTEQGEAYVFVESGGTWSQQAELTASDGTVEDFFGTSIGVSGSTVVVGSPGPYDSTSYNGAAYVFVSGSGPAVSLSPTSLSFSKLAIDNTSAAKSVTLKNTGTATLDISSVTINGDFAISANTCGATLAVKKTCKVSVTFMPTALGASTGTLSFTDNATGSPQAVSLSGSGVEPATVTPASAAYGKRPVGTISAPKMFTLTNNQTTTLDISSIGIVGAEPEDFAVSATTCTATLVAKGKCTISVRFTPRALGLQGGQLSISDSASDSPQTSSLSGTGD